LENKEICLKIFTNEKFCHFLNTQKFLVVIKDFENLPHIEDYDPTSNPPYIAQEVVAGRSLRQLIREQKKFPVDMAFKLITKVIHALKKMHQQNIAHLDLRPEHLILDEQGNLKILDYLLGKITTLTLAEYYKEFTAKGVSMSKPLMRSLLYKPRRQRLGQELGIQADVFAIGILLFEIVTGTYPNRKAIYPSSLVPDLPPKVDQIYSHCCGRGEGMFESCEEILEAIEAKEDIEQMLSNLPGIELIADNIAMVSITTLAGNKHYVDGKNIVLLSANLDNIMATNLRFVGFDFQNIDYLNSSAIGFLVNISDRIANLNGATVMFNVDKKVMTILSALGLEKVIHILESREEAEEYLQKLAKQNPPSE